MAEKFYQYDLRGNMTAVSKGGKTVNQYAYDVTNRLASASIAKGQKVIYQYDGIGNRIAADMYGLEGSYSSIAPEEPTKRVEYLLDITKQYRNLLEKIETADGQEAIQRYTWDNTVEFMSEQEGAYTYLQDESGSTLRLIRSCDDYQSVYGYDEFGVDLYGTQGETQPFGYTGYQKDTIANTYFAQAREYLPQIGRFAGNDFINGNRFEPLTFNKYWYCKNSPMNWVDLDGLKPKKDKDDIDWWEFLFGDSPFLNKNKVTTQVPTIENWYYLKNQFCSIL